MHQLIRQLSRASLLCVLVLCGTSIIWLNIRTTTIFQDFTTLYLRKESNVLTIRDTTWITPPRTIGTTTFPSDILHDWKDNEAHVLAIYILSAIGFNKTSSNGFKANVKLTGWVAKRDRSTAIKCCVLLKSGVISKVREWTTVHTMKFKRGHKLAAHQYECRLNMSIDNVRGVSLQFNKLQCPENNDRYIKPFIPKKVDIEESFAICLKIVYEQVNNAKLKDWLDYNRAIGVDKVFMYTYNITQATRDLLGHYVNSGFVDKRPFAYPWNSTRHIGDKEPQVWEDERVVIKDCIQRLSRYKYIAVVDIDEFLVLRKHDNLKSMMKYLMKTYPKAGGFRLQSYIFDKDVRPDSNTSTNLPDYMVYFKRTSGLSGAHSRQKNIVLPSRVTADGYNTHRFETALKYRKIKLGTTHATINHYRHCYTNLEEVCANLTTDTYMLNYYNTHIARNNTKLTVLPEQ